MYVKQHIMKTTKKKSSLKENAKAIAKKVFTHFYEDDHMDEAVNPKLRLATSK